MIFYSNSRKLRLWTSRGLIKFENHKFETDDVETINVLKAHKNFGGKGLGAFTAMSGGANTSTVNIVKGTRGGAHNAAYAEEKVPITPAERLEHLKKKVLDKSGKIKKNFVKKADVEEFKTLYKQINGKDFEVADDNGGNVSNVKDEA